MQKRGCAVASRLSRALSRRALVAPLCDGNVDLDSHLTAATAAGEDPPMADPAIGAASAAAAGSERGDDDVARVRQECMEEKNRAGMEDEGQKEGLLVSVRKSGEEADRGRHESGGQRGREDEREHREGEEEEEEDDSLAEHYDPAM